MEIDETINGEPGKQLSNNVCASLHQQLHINVQVKDKNVFGSTTIGPMVLLQNDTLYPVSVSYLAKYQAPKITGIQW